MANYFAKKIFSSILLFFFISFFKQIFLQKFGLLSRRFGPKCSGCNQGISPTDLVRRAKDKVFHLNCFTCCMCRKPISTGEQLYVVDENKFMCKQDYILNKPQGIYYLLFSCYFFIFF
jgi:hypothetical protein